MEPCCVYVAFAKGVEGMLLFFFFFLAIRGVRGVGRGVGKGEKGVRCVDGLGSVGRWLVMRWKLGMEMGRG